MSPLPGYYLGDLGKERRKVLRDLINTKQLSYDQIIRSLSTLNNKNPELGSTIRRDISYVKKHFSQHRAVKRPSLGKRSSLKKRSPSKKRSPKLSVGKRVSFRKQKVSPKHRVVFRPSLGKRSSLKKQSPKRRQYGGGRKGINVQAPAFLPRRQVPVVPMAFIIVSNIRLGKNMSLEHIAQQFLPHLIIVPPEKVREYPFIYVENTGYFENPLFARRQQVARPVERKLDEMEIEFLRQNPWLDEN